jgi:hypothetical protein
VLLEVLSIMIPLEPPVAVRPSRGAVVPIKAVVTLKE